MAAPALPWLRAVRGDQPGIYDPLGRQVLLRGANFNHLGDYFAAEPSLPEVAELTEEDWAGLAARGGNVVRLVTTWSAWEPERGQVDPAYVARVRAAVADAARHGIYSVIDMHQDAWSKHVFTPRDEVCPEGTRHQIGWDGAPAWATFTDGAATCTAGGREQSPAVVRAWANFYDNREGIRDRLAALWGAIAAEFAHESNVAGFDLLNEPGHSGNLFRTVAGLTEFYRSAIAAIREAERRAGAPGHAVFFETTVFGAFVAPDFSDDTNLVFAPHNYGESIGPDIPGLMDLLFAWNRLQAAVYRTAMWIGEYGFWSADPTPKLERFAALEDRAPSAGSTWWQWEQECGDPHEIGGVYPADPEWVERQQARCGGPPNSMPCTDRAYPRAVPGRLTGLEAPCGGGFLVLTGSTTEPSTAGLRFPAGSAAPPLATGSSPGPSTADLWFPAASGVPPAVRGANIEAVTTRQVPGGWRLEVRVHGDYRIEVTEALVAPGV